MVWSEAKLHAWLGRRGRPPVLRGDLGHDAAVLRGLDGLPVVCADQTIEGVHFESGTPGKRVGRKAAARALSDLAATASEPRALVSTLRAPAEASETWLRAVLLGIIELGDEYAAPLVGGDLALAPGPLGIGVTALGTYHGSGRPPGRERARAGDVVLVTGPLGGSRLGRHLTFAPRLREGQYLHHVAGARALMDVSDGLAIDLDRLARASSVRIDLFDVPVHRDAVRAARSDRRRPLMHALEDGEDHELIAVLPAVRWKRHHAEATARFPGIAEVGRVRTGRGLFLIDEAGDLARWDGRGGYRHGS